MQITILNIANKAPAWIVAATNEYLKRINHGKYSCDLIELKADKVSYKTPIENMELEAKKFLSKISKDSFIVALDERGKTFTSPGFAKYLETTALNFKHITFIIGGADGIHPNLLEKCNAQISLSKMVFPHMLF